MKDRRLEVALIFAGLVFCWFSLGGLSDLMPMQWALPLALLITLLYSIACCQMGASRKPGSRIGFGVLAALMWAAVVISDGLSFNEIITHEEGDRIITSKAAARAHYSEAELERREAELIDLHTESDRLLAEAVEAEAAARPAVFSTLEAELARELRTGPGPKSRAIEARIETLREKEAAAAGIRTRHKAVLGRIAEAEARIVANRAAVRENLTDAAVAEDTQHFLFNLASAKVGRDRDKTGAFLSLLGTMFFGALELVFGCLCAVAANRKPHGEDRRDPPPGDIERRSGRSDEEAAKITHLAQATANRPVSRSAKVPGNGRTVPSPEPGVPSREPDECAKRGKTTPIPPKNAPCAGSSSPMA